MADSRTSKRLTAGIVAIIVLAICLGVTTYALVWSMVSVDNNLFQTGRVKINLNDGVPVIEEHEFLFEPGMTVVKPFFLENESTWDVWYRLYFVNIEGGLADFLEVTICEGNYGDESAKVIYTGKLSEMNEEQTLAAEDALMLHERKEMTITFHFPEETGNEAQGLSLNFDLVAEAVQTKNNPEGIFN